MADALPTLSELLARAIASGAADINVSMPGEIVSYDPSTQIATVKPCLRRVVFNPDDEQVAEELPPIQNVPVCWPGGTGITMHGTLSAGDTGDLLFSTYSHNEWQASGQVSTPGDLKLHNLGSAKFYPGLRNKRNAAPDTDNSIGKPGGQRLHFGSTIDAGAGAQFVALSNATEARLQALEAFAAAHVHTSAAAGSPTTPAVPPFVATATPVASSNLKADA